jgi:hypothetical protein
MSITCLLARPALNSWIPEVASWGKVRPAVVTVVEKVRREGATFIGVSTRQVDL